MTITVTSWVVDGILAEARNAHPRECCGLLFGSETLIIAHRPAANVHSEPARHFEIDPQALIDAHRAMRAGGPRLAGYYHSHPRGAPEPSAADRAMALRDGLIWAIAGEERLTLWRAGHPGGSDGLTPLPYRVTDA